MTFHAREIVRHRLRCSLWFVSAALFAHSALALDPSKAMAQYIHDRWGAERGFLGGAIYAIRQSADGYLWIATERGLVRFDGFEFTLIQRPIAGAPPLGPVRGLVTDAEGNLWVRLDGPRLLLYRDGHFEDAFARFGVVESTITAMSYGNRDELILAGIGNHILRYQHGKFEIIAGADEAPGTVLSMAQTIDGRVWLGTRDDGLFGITQGNISKVSNELVNAKINTLFATDKGGLWIGTDNGMHLWNGNGLADPTLPASIHQLQILAISKDRDKNLWVGTSRGLLRITSAGTVSLALVDQVAGSDVAAICEDNEGDVWFGGSHGLERLRDGVFTSYSTAQGLPAEVNGPVYVDSEGRTWFAPAKGGLYWLKDGQVGRVSAAGLDDDVVYSISGGGGEVWLGRQRGGLTVLRDVAGSLVARTYLQADGMAQNSVYSVHRNRDGTVWAGTVSGGVSRLRDGVFTNYSVSDGLGSNFVSSIVEGFDGRMWFATPGGLGSFADGHWVNRSARDGLPSSDVRSVFEDAHHVLWIATANGLAALFDGRLQVPQNLPDSLREQIFGFAEDERGFLWIATTDHVLQVNRDRLRAESLDPTDVRSYGAVDGLEEVGAVRRNGSVASDSQGRIWFSLKHGLAVANTRLLLRNAVPVKVRIESISAGGAAIGLDGSPKIAPGGQSITFNYVGTSLSTPEKVVFRYKLDGSGQGWSNVVALRQVVFTNLDPGSYRFRAIASNGLGLWDGPETIFPFVIQPAFWQTWWFRFACLSACVLAIMALYHLRMVQLTHRLNALFRERLAERTRIAQDLHDTLLQGILSASMQLDVAQDQVAESSPAKPRLRRVLELMRQVTDEGRGALQGLRSSEKEGLSLEESFSRVRQELATDEKTGYRVIVHGVTRPLRPVIRDEAYRIGREALVNAFLHAQANSVELEVEYTGRFLRLVVRDDGCGVDPQVMDLGREGHWGLIGMRERSERVGATFKLRSRLGAGTEVEFRVPAVLAFESHAGSSFFRGLRWRGRNKVRPVAGDSKEEGSE
jgi:signal transduction histidine kinase/ligand-binding sensor domain-containing protein